MTTGLNSWELTTFVITQSRGVMGGGSLGHGPAQQ